MLSNHRRIGYAKAACQEVTLPAKDAKFIFRSFAPTGEGWVSVRVSETLLCSQDHLTATRESIEKCMATGSPTWQLRLKVEDTQPFDADFTRLGMAAAVVRILRGDAHAILIVVADAAADIDFRGMDVVRKAIQGFAGDAEINGPIDWITGTAPPLAALLYLTGKSNNGVDMLGISLASGFLGQVLH